MTAIEWVSLVLSRSCHRCLASAECPIERSACKSPLEATMAATTPSRRHWWGCRSLDWWRCRRSRAALRAHIATLPAWLAAGSTILRLAECSVSPTTPCRWSRPAVQSLHRIQCLAPSHPSSWGDYSHDRSIEQWTRPERDSCARELAYRSNHDILLHSSDEHHQSAHSVALSKVRVGDNVREARCAQQLSAERHQRHVRIGERRARHQWLIGQPLRRVDHAAQHRHAGRRAADRRHVDVRRERRAEGRGLPHRVVVPLVAAGQEHGGRRAHHRLDPAVVRRWFVEADQGRYRVESAIRELPDLSWRQYAHTQAHTPDTGVVATHPGIVGVGAWGSQHEEVAADGLVDHPLEALVDIEAAALEEVAAARRHRGRGVALADAVVLVSRCLDRERGGGTGGGCWDQEEDECGGGDEETQAPGQGQWWWCRVVGLHGGWTRGRQQRNEWRGPSRSTEGCLPTTAGLSIHQSCGYCGILIVLVDAPSLSFISFNTLVYQQLLQVYLDW